MRQIRDNDKNMKKIILAVLAVILFCALAKNSRGAVILGQTTNDTFTTNFFTQKDNANKIVQGINGASNPITNVSGSGNIGIQETNFYTYTGKLLLTTNQVSGGNTYTIMDTTNMDSVFGHVHIHVKQNGTNVANVDTAVDASLFISDPAAVCQFQGVIPNMADAFSITASVDGAGRFKLQVQPHLDGETFFFEIFGADIPSLALTETNVAALTYGITFTPFDKQIAGNALLGKEFYLFDINGGKFKIADLPSGLVGDNQATIYADYFKNPDGASVILYDQFNNLVLDASSSGVTGNGFASITGSTNDFRQCITKVSDAIGTNEPTSFYQSTNAFAVTPEYFTNTISTFTNIGRVSHVETLIKFVSAATGTASVRIDTGHSSFRITPEASSLVGTVTNLYSIPNIAPGAIVSLTDTSTGTGCSVLILTNVISSPRFQ